MQQVFDSVRFYYGSMEDTGYDYPLSQHLQAAQGTLELYVTACKARDSHEAQATDAASEEGQKGQGNSDAMADQDVTMPPSKRAARGGWDRKHGWTDVQASTIPVPQDGDDGTATPKLLQPDHANKDEDFPSLDEAAASSQGQIPTPTARVLRGFTADTRRALAEARHAARNRLRGKQKAAQAEGTPSAAEEAMDELLREMKSTGTPAGGTESGTLASSAGTSSTAGQPSEAPRRRSGDAMPSGVSEQAATSQPPGPTPDASGQPSGDKQSCDQFPGGDGEDDL